MSLKHKEEFKLTPAHLIRIAIFLVLIYFSINYLSTKTLTTPAFKDPTTILGQQTQNQNNLKKYTDKLYQSLPPESQNILNNIDQNPAIISLQQKLDELKEQTQGFPQKQIKEIQKELLKRFYQNALESIDN